MRDAAAARLPRRGRLVDDDLVLRGVRQDDRAARMRLGRDPEIYRLLGHDPTRDGPFTLIDAVQWQHRLKRLRYAWVIEIGGRVIGATGFKELDMSSHYAELAIEILDPALLGHGIGRRALRLILRFGFERLQLHRVGLRVIAANERAIRCYRACGFRVEGREREAVELEGDWQDDLIMGVLRPEFEAACGVTTRPESVTRPAAPPSGG